MKLTNKIFLYIFKNIFNYRKKYTFYQVFSKSKNIYQEYIF